MISKKALRKICALLLTLASIATMSIAPALNASAQSTGYYIRGTTTKNALSYSVNEPVTYKFSLYDSNNNRVGGQTVNYSYNYDAPVNAFQSEKALNLPDLITNPIPAQSDSVTTSATEDVSIEIPGINHAGCIYFALWTTVGGQYVQVLGGVAVDFDNIKRVTEKPANFNNYWTDVVDGLVKGNENSFDNDNINYIDAEEYPDSTFTSYTLGDCDYELNNNNGKLKNYKAFWENQNTEARITILKEDVTANFPVDPNNFTIYDVKIESGCEFPVSGYLSVPKNVTSAPIQVYYHGYGLSSSNVVPLNDQICFDMNNCGLPNGLKDEEYTRIREHVEKDNSREFSNKLNESLNTSCYTKTVKRVIRGLQFVKSVSTANGYTCGWNQKNLAVEGGSYAGFQSFVAAALDNQVTSCTALIPWMCEPGSEYYGCISSTFRPEYVKDNTVIDYFNTVNFAEMINPNCKVAISNVGLGDTLCPAYGIIVLYNTLCKNVYNVFAKFYQDSGHGDTPSYPDYYKTKNNEYITEKFRLAGVTLTDGTLKIGKGADPDILNATYFQKDPNIEHIVLNAPQNTIAQEAFRDLYNLEDFTCGDGGYVKTVSTSAFYDCPLLISVNFGKGLEEIKGFAFNNCTALKNITIPEAAESKTLTVGGGAFSSAVSLESIVFTGSAANVSVRPDAFAYTIYENVPEVKVDESSQAFTQLRDIKVPVGTAESNSEFSLNINPGSLTYNYDTKTLTVGENVTSLSKERVDAFLATLNNVSRSDVEAIVINGKVDVGEQAFNSMTSLTSLTFGENGCFTTIGSLAFWGCHTRGAAGGLGEVSLPKGLVKISERGLQGSGITVLTIPEAVDGSSITIENFILGDWDATYKVVFADTTTYDVEGSSNPYIFPGSANDGILPFPDWTFNNQSGAAVYAKEGTNAYEKLSEILDSAALNPDVILSNGFNNETTLYIEKDNLQIGRKYYDNKSIKKLVIDAKGVVLNKEEGKGSFENCSSLQSIEFINGGYIKTVGESAFTSCGLSSVDFPEGLETIERFAFNGCLSLTSLTLPSTVTVLDDAFLHGVPNGSTIKIYSSNVDFCGNPSWAIPENLVIYGVKGSTTETVFAAAATNCTFIPLEPTVKPGDINNNGIYDDNDLALLKKILLDESYLNDPAVVLKEAAYVNEDEVIDIRDLVSLYKLVYGIQ